MAITVLGEHGEVGDDLASFGIGPLAPQACQGPGGTIRPPETPPDVLASHPVGFVLAPCGDQAALTSFPSAGVGPSGGHGLTAGIVGAQAPAIAGSGYAGLGGAGDHSPLADFHLAASRDEGPVFQWGDGCSVELKWCSNLKPGWDVIWRR